MNQTKHIIEIIDSKDIFLLSLDINGYSIFNIMWNLALVMVPFAVLLLIRRIWASEKSIGRIAVLPALFLIWLLFIPNTAYIITDVRHILDYCPVSRHRICLEGAWVPLFFYMYATVGWVTFVLLLNQMKDFLFNIGGKKIANLFIILLIPLISIGVLIGLIERWNSWEIFSSPLLIARSISNYFTDFHYFKILLIYTLSLYVLYYAGDRLLKRFKF